MPFEIYSMSQGTSFNTMIRMLAVIILLLLPPAAAAPAEIAAAQKRDHQQGNCFFARLGRPDKNGLALQLANNYDPNFNITSVTSNFSLHYDHGLLWDNVRSGNKELKLEGVLGALVRPDVRLMLSIGMLYAYYPDLAFSKRIKSYVEAGIGGIYTDYRVDGAAYRLNFNPQLGIGAVLPSDDGGAGFIGFRLHHISNGRTNSDNQGVNSLLIQVGRYF